MYLVRLTPLDKSSDVIAHFFSQWMSITYIDIGEIMRILRRLNMILRDWPTKNTETQLWEAQARHANGIVAIQDMLYALFCIEYIHKGYMYSGRLSIPKIEDVFQYDDFWPSLQRLLESGRIIQVDCDVTAYELPPETRMELVCEKNLKQRWLNSSYGGAFYPLSREGEIGNLVYEHFPEMAHILTI